MRNLRLYNTDADFKAHERAAGGDGNDTVTVVPGVCMSSDQRKRYFNPHDASILVQELKINYYIGNKNLATGNTRVKFVSGVSTDGYAKITPIKGKSYEISEPYASVTLPADSSTTISAKCSSNFYIKCTYNVTTTSSRTCLYNTKPSFLWGIIIDGKTAITGSSITTGYTFSTTGEHEVIFCYSGTSHTLPMNTYYRCTNMTSAEISSGFLSLGEYSFYGCSALKKVIIPDTLTDISHYCFNQCSSLTNITIPSGVTNIGNYCFEGCKLLRRIKCYATIAPTISQQTFFGVAENGTLFYPSGSDYSTWLAKATYYLGLYNWTGQEI